MPRRKQHRQPIEITVRDGLTVRTERGVEIGRTTITKGRQMQYIDALIPFLNAKEGDEIVFIVVGGEVLMRSAASLK